jgi:hypothetical protein
MKQNCVPALLGDEYRHLRHGAMIWHVIRHVMEREVRVHRGFEAEVKRANSLH